MLDRLLALFKTKPTEQVAREQFERRLPEALLAKHVNGEYLDRPTQAAWDEFLTEYVQSTWW